MTALTDVQFFVKYQGSISLETKPDGTKGILVSGNPETVARTQEEIERLGYDAVLAELIAYNEDNARRAAAYEGIREGVEAIRAAREQNRKARAREVAAIESDDGRLPAVVRVDVAAIKAQYPRAAAYLKAEEYHGAANDHKSSAGKKAMHRILDGDDIDAVLAEMENWLPENAFWD